MNSDDGLEISSVDLLEEESQIVDPIHVIAVIVFALNVFLVSSSFFPNLHEINAWDEAGYVNSGRVLLEGQWPSFSSSPLVALLYALTSFAYLESPFWLVHSTTLGRIILFGLVWFSSYAVARRLGGTARPLFMVGLLFVGALMVSLLSFPSDPLYVAFAALSLASAMAYISSGRWKHLGLASVFIGLAALSRNDGLVLGLALILATPFLVRPPESRRKAIAIAAAPFALLVGGYVLFFGIKTGDFSLGTLERTYDNFEAGHQVITAGEGLVNPVIEAKLAAREAFGTPEENGHSIFRAIARNPGVYLQRLRAIVPLLPAQMLSAYGVRLAAPLFLFAARGVWELFRQRRGDHVRGWLSGRGRGSRRCGTGRCCRSRWRRRWRSGRNWWDRRGRCRTGRYRDSGRRWRSGSGRNRSRRRNRIGWSRCGSRRSDRGRNRRCMRRCRPRGRCGRRRSRSERRCLRCGRRRWSGNRRRGGDGWSRWCANR